MKNGNWKISYQYLLFFIFLLSPNFLFAQQSINASGGDALGINGSVSYSIGQIIYTTEFSDNLIFFQGVQQAHEFFVIPDLAEKEKFALVTAVFPNPTSNYLILEVKDISVSSPLHVVLLSVSGQQVYMQEVTNPRTQIQLDHLASSLYFLKVTQGNTLIKVVKIIKK